MVTTKRAVPVKLKIFNGVLLNEKMSDARISKQVTPYLEEADSLRKRAEKEAGGGNYKGAVVTLEESTRQVTRAIRMAGIYIPG